MAADDVLLIERRGPVAVLTLNRPAAKNALDAALAGAVSDALIEADADEDVAVIVLTGAGGTFCAGMDLKAFVRGESPEVEGRGLAGLTAAPPATPLIAAVEGWALAGGFEMVLACDLVVAAEDARFGIPEVKRGLVAAAGGLLRLPKTLPYQLAMELALTGDPIDAPTAHRHGLVNRLSPPGGALDAALELAARIAANGPLAVAVSKQVVAGAVRWTDGEALAAQAALVDPVFTSADAREGATAFAEKRAPRWTGH